MAIVCRTWKSLMRAMNCTDKTAMGIMRIKSLLICSAVMISLIDGPLGKNATEPDLQALKLAMELSF
jgi:hypothetical protein